MDIRGLGFGVGFKPEWMRSWLFLCSGFVAEVTTCEQGAVSSERSHAKLCFVPHHERAGSLRQVNLSAFSLSSLEDGGLREGISTEYNHAAPPVAKDDSASRQPHWRLANCVIRHYHAFHTTY